MGMEMDMELERRAVTKSYWAGGPCKEFGLYLRELASLGGGG
jgi:hypothetical protein